MPRVTQAKDRPALTATAVLDTNDVALASPGPRMQGNGHLDDPQIEIVANPTLDPEKMANLAFMEELVTVHIHDNPGETAEQIFEVGVNGKRELFVRGEKKTVKRKFVNELAMARHDTIVQVKERDDAGTLKFKNVTKSALKYPFSILEDKNPIGSAWLSAVMQQAQ